MRAASSVWQKCLSTMVKGSMIEGVLSVLQVRVAKSLCDGGSTGVFSPMHLLVFKKPASPGKDQVANHVSA